MTRRCTSRRGRGTRCSQPSPPSKRRSWRRTRPWLAIHLDEADEIEPGELSESCTVLNGGTGLPSSPLGLSFTSTLSMAWSCPWKSEGASPRSRFSPVNLRIKVIK